MIRTVFVTTAAFSLALLAFPPRAEAASDPDPWFGRDKMLHFSVSAAIASGTYALSATQFDARYPPLLLGAGTALAVGIAKETADALGSGTASWKDLTWDLAGTIAGLGFAWAIDLLIRGVSNEHPLFGAPHPASHVPSQGAWRLGPPEPLLIRW